MGCYSQRSASLAPKAGSDLGRIAASHSSSARSHRSQRKKRQTERLDISTVRLCGGYAINVLAPHIPATLIFGQYTPGVVTAVLINLPVMSILLYKAVHDRWVSGTRAVRYALLVPLVIAGSILGLFTLA